MTHECVFVEEREPSGRLILPPCLTCGLTAMDALDQLRQEVGSMTEECWIPADGSPGVAYLEFDALGHATITRQCLGMLMERAGYVRVDKP